MRTFSSPLQHGDDVISDVSKNAFTDKDGQLTKAFQKKKHDTASQLLLMKE